MSKCSNCIHRYVCELKCAYEDNDRECLDFDEERPQGEWIYHTDGYISFHTCNRCNGFGDIDDKFCRHCGADMRKGGAK